MGSHGGVEYSFDDLGGYATISIDTRVFGEAAILKTAYWLTDQYYLYLFRDGTHPESKLIVELRLKKQGDQIFLENACREFSNNLLDQEVRQTVQAETSGLRDSLVQKAFFEGRPRAFAGQAILINCHSRLIDNSLYPKKAVADAKMAYKDYCNFSVESASGNQVKLTVEVKLNQARDSHEVILGFWNYLLDRSCQIKAEV